MKDSLSQVDPKAFTEPRIFCWGSGTFGQHGHIIDDTVCAFDGILKNPSVNILAVYCGAFYTFALKGDGTALGWGSNQNGQLGCSHQRHCLTPTRASIDAEVAQASAGDRHSLFLLRDGTVRGCGCNFYGQLSVDALEEMQRQDRLIPVTLTLPDKVKQVACGQYHSLLLCSSGEVVSVGRNIYGQLGVPMPDGVKTDVLETPTPIENAFRSPVASIAAGQNHSIAIDDAGRCYVWGYCRACGSRGDHVIKPKLLNFPVASAEVNNSLDTQEQPSIACASGGSSHSLFLSASGFQLFALGCNLDGQCGLGERVNFAASPMLVEILWASTDETVGAWIKSVDCAENYSCAVTASGELWMWGRNSGVLPAFPTTTIDTATSTAAPGVQAAADTAAPRLFSPRRVPVPFAVLSASCGNWHAAAVVDYKAPKDVSHLPDGRSGRQPVAPAATDADTADDTIWADVMSSRTEKPQLLQQTPRADGIVVGCDPLALEDVAENDDSGLSAPSQAPEPLEPSPPPQSRVAAQPMRRTKSLNRFQPSSVINCEEASRLRQAPRLRRFAQQLPTESENSEVVRVYLLASAGSGRPGTATYQTAQSSSNGPPHLRHGRQRPPSGQRRLQLLDANADAVSTSGKPPLQAPSVPPAQPRGAIGASVKLRPTSVGAQQPALPVRQNRASLRRMSSSGRVGSGVDLV
ncbi:hypothetical protein BOX15_Mlig006981g1 [Macrostomum lignano]|uniref:RCC1-like domain-containing protein n=2 Tax=Macrostomum lignano TaxID=282301 RepID=A0A267GLP6_9PLAT|nr:hypothetical protein BOX15_Mlig006981g1 [Macrostomum lignano]